MFWIIKIAFKNIRNSHAKRLSVLLFHRISPHLDWLYTRFLNAISVFRILTFSIGKLNVLENENRVQKHKEFPRQTLVCFTFLQDFTPLGLAIHTFSERDFRSSEYWLSPLENLMFWKMKIAFKNIMNSHAKCLSVLLFHRISPHLDWLYTRFLNATFGLRNIDFLHWKT